MQLRGIPYSAVPWASLQQLAQLWHTDIIATSPHVKVLRRALLEGGACDNYTGYQCMEYMRWPTEG